MKNCGGVSVDFWPSIGMENLVPKSRVDETGGIRQGKSHMTSIGIPRDESAALIASAPVLSVIAYVFEDLRSVGDPEAIDEILKKRVASLSELNRWKAIVSAELDKAKAHGVDQIDVSSLKGRGHVDDYRPGAARLAAQMVEKEVFSLIKAVRATDGQRDLADRESLEACLRFLQLRIQNGSGHVPREIRQ
ncbi:hypothetical protein [Paludibaculum fermentans]|uniref:hypothetical protein n=1 Tax=Paludibaculum fermentans TaxID=1473598 RepID=UPI003EBCA2CC